MKALVFFLLLGIAQPLFSLGIHKWVDEDGNKIYGNNPPENVLSDKVTLPELTIVAGENNYKETSEPSVETLGSESDSKALTNKPAKQPSTETQKEDTVVGAIEIVSPKPDETIRANDGNVTVTFAIKPKLKDGESIVVYLDGKQQATSSTFTIKLKALSRGTHSLFAVKRGSSGNVITNSQNIKFHVLRHSKLF